MIRLGGGTRFERRDSTGAHLDWALDWRNVDASLGITRRRQTTNERARYFTVIRRIDNKYGGRVRVIPCDGRRGGAL